jgi:hypothetical protein
MPSEKLPSPHDRAEKRGAVSEVVVPLVQSGVGGAVAGYVGAKVTGGQKPPDPPKKDSA